MNRKFLRVVIAVITAICISIPAPFAAAADEIGYEADDSELACVSYAMAPILGDADNSGWVDICDATIVERYITVFPVPYDIAQLMNADVDQDGELTVVDATFIQRYDDWIDVPYAIGETIPGTVVELPVRHINLPVGGKFTLKALTDVTKNITWKCSNTNIATVSGSGTKATVTAKKSGKATVTVTLEKGAQAVCTVDVTTTKTSDSLKSQINSLPLYPVKTGYVALDNKVQSIFKSIFKSGYTTYDKLKAVYDYELFNFSYEYISLTSKQQKDFYDNSGNKEPESYYDCRLAERAYATLMNNKGVCYNYAAVFTVMMRAIGLECFSIDGTSTYADGHWDVHTWNNIIVNGKYLIFDAQVDDNIYNKVGYKYIERFGLKDSDSLATENYKYKSSDRLDDLSYFNYFD